VPHSCQVKTVSATLFCLYGAVVFTDQPRALELFSAAVSPQTERCAGWLAVPVRTGASVQRSAHSTVASLNTSSHGTYDLSCTRSLRDCNSVHAVTPLLVCLFTLHQPVCAVSREDMRSYILLCHANGTTTLAHVTRKFGIP